MARTSLCLALLLIWGCLCSLRVGKISVEANFELDRDALLKAAGLATGEEYDAAVVNAGIEGMQAWLQKQGHPFVSIPSPELVPLDQDSLELAFRLDEVMPAGDVGIHFNGLKLLTPAKLRALLLLSPEQRLTLGQIPSLMQRVLQEYLRQGYLFAAVELDSLVLDGGLEAYIGVEEGRPFRLEKYHLRGNKYTRERTLIRLAGLERAGTITPEKLEAARQNILRKSYINACSVEPVDAASLLISVEEGRMTYLEGVAGFNRIKGKTELTGRLNLRFLNLWGTDRALALRWQKSALNSLLEFSYHESGPANLPLAGDLTLHRTEQDSVWIRSRVAADIYSYQGFQRYGISLATESISPGSGRPMQITKSSNWSVGAFWIQDSSDNPLNPSRGSSSQIAYRVRRLHSPSHWSNALEADHTHFLSLGKRWVLAAGAHLRSLAEEDSSAYLQYGMGGYNSLRGYREEEFSSWRLGWANLELRWRLAANSRLYLFYDHGVMMRGNDELDARLFAPGLGIKVGSRLGVLSIEYGLGFRDKSFPSFTSGMIHAGLDTSF